MEEYELHHPLCLMPIKEFPIPYWEFTLSASSKSPLLSQNILKISKKFTYISNIYFNFIS